MRRTCRSAATRGPARDVRRARAVKSLLAVLAVAFALTLALSAFAGAYQQYSFEAPNETVRVQINQDSSIDFWYRIEFANDADADPIDIVDMGMPAGNYDLSSCSAAVNGQPLQDIRVSTVVSPGVEVHLNEWLIQPGQTGVFEFHGKNPQMVYQDTEHEGYASVEFMNTWWDPAYAHGNTILTTQMQFPPGVQPNETVYHEEEYTTATNVEGLITFTWVETEAKPSEGYVHGVSFPAVYVQGVYPQQPLPDYEPVTTNTYSSSSYSSSANLLRVLVPFGAVLIITIIRSVMSVIKVKKKGAKVDYIKPALGIEGTGPVKNLFPAEAAMLTSQDLDRVTAVALFEMLSRGIIGVESVKPLKLIRSMAVPEGSAGYYGPFMAAIGPDGTLDRDSLKLAVKSLVTDVEKKVKGFSEAETMDYYKSSTQSSWAAVKSAPPGEKVSRFTTYLPYLLLDAGFGEKVREVFGRESLPLPAWALGLARAEGVGGPAATATGEIVVSGDALAESLAMGFRSMQDAAFKETKEFEEELIKEVNPQEYKRVYVPMFMRHGYGRGGGGGGGCACACACAGCACACAGGGR